MARANTIGINLSGPPRVASSTNVTQSLEQQRLDLLGPVYLLEWPSGQRHCTRTHLGGASELRASLRREGRNSPGHTRRLFVIHGLPSDCLDVLKEALNIDARFVDAHVGRRIYRPLTKRRRVRDEAFGFAYFEYPELLASATADGHISLADGVLGGPPVHMTSADGQAVMFCHASLWLSPKADVLLVDRPIWTRPSSYFQKAHYRSSGASPAFGEPGTSSDTLHNEHTNTLNGEEIPCFETLLYETLAEQANDSVDVDVRSLVEDVTLHQWSGFFEILSTDLPVGAIETTALYWQAQKSLERNLSDSQFHDRSYHSLEPSSTTGEWEALLSRLGRRATLLNQLNPIVTNIQLPSEQTQPPSQQEQPTNPITIENVPTFIPRRRRRTRARGPSNTNNGNSSSDDDNKHSLDRVSYMGGVLLPLSIVSSILSMSDPFGPTGNQFFVFWAASIPLVLIVLLIIYADTIRKAEVWIEVASNASSSETAIGEKPHDEEAGQAMPYSETIQISAPPTTRVGISSLRPENEEDGDEYSEGESFDEPSMMVEKLFKNGGNRKWRKEQLGWTGACKTAFRIYRLKKGKPPNWVGETRHGRTL
ncbi:uncharacterized protein F4822DRAFT_429517 [Hypoxylon trugodes]|uniref:uncharacterized protein n=1 Tax=Hypoxylon trugodes TaxID=326681 RepID=UPI00219133FD|nr:uncharacterized protein F4822DRAFT_429517 [Hypoxylon trugodes]KAI1388900.1 hypothetical protein F4822DRAFT_429517 [Hypoxylon trugodes]